MLTEFVDASNADDAFLGHRSWSLTNAADIAPRGLKGNRRLSKAQSVVRLRFWHFARQRWPRALNLVTQV